MQKEERTASLKAIPSEPSDPRDENTRARLSKGWTGNLQKYRSAKCSLYLGDQLKIQFYIDRKSMGVEGIAEDVPVNFNLKDVPGEMILDLVLRELGLAYTIRSGVVMVASKSDIQSQTEVRVYPVTNGAEELAQLIPNTIEPHTWRYVSNYPMPVVEPYASPRQPNAIGGVGALEEGGRWLDSRISRRAGRIANAGRAPEDREADQRPEQRVEQTTPGRENASQRQLLIVTG